MRRSFPPIYNVLSFRDGWVIEYLANRRAEYLGSDKLWHRRPEHCDPFPTREEADAALAKEVG